MGHPNSGGHHGPYRLDKVPRWWLRMKDIFPILDGDDPLIISGVKGEA